MWLGKYHQRLQAVPHGIAAGHQLRPRRRADRHAIERLQPHAIVRQTVDVRSFDVAAAIAEIGVAEIVGQDNDDVGFRFLRVCQSNLTSENAAHEKR